MTGEDETGGGSQPQASGERVSVILADDHPVFRDGMARAIEERDELELVAQVGDGRDALREIERAAPDVALLDIRMPGLDGREVLAAVRANDHSTKVVFLSAYMDSEIAYAAIAGGAGGYLAKSASREAICNAIVSAAHGETVLAPEVQSAIAGEIVERERALEQEPPLRERERQVLKLIAEGASAREIGERLNLAESTVKTHLRTLYEKLGVSERAAAVAEAMRRGLLE